MKIINNKKMIKMLAALMVLALSLSLFTGCGKEEVSAATGTIILKVNPEFEIGYDDKGDVISVMPMNEDAGHLMEHLDDYQGRHTSDVITSLVALMEKEGYIEKETKGDGRNINIQVKYGSSMPDEEFLDTIITNVKSIFDDKKVTGKVIVSGESNYGVSEYEVSDYGNSDYKESKNASSQTKVNNTNYSDSVYDSTSVYDAVSIYDSNSGYDSNSVYDNDSGYKSNGSSSQTTSKPAKNQNTNNTDYGDSVYDSNSSYDSNSGYDNNSNYDNDSGYDNDSNYDNDSGYDNDSEYDD